jgi:MFS family permease
MMCSLFLWGIGESMWFYIRGLYLEGLGAMPQEVGLALGIAALTHAAAYVLGGVLADRFDRKFLLVAGWLTGVVAAPLMALAGDWRAFMIGFSVYNISAFVIPVIDTYVTQAAGRAPLERVLPVVFSSYWVGSVLGPQASKVLLTMTDERGVLLASSLVFAASTAVIAFVRAQPAARRPSPPHTAGEGSRHWQPHVGPVQALRPALSFLVYQFAIFFSMALGAQLIPNYLIRIGWQSIDVSGIVSALPLGIAVLTVAVGHFAAGRNRRGLLTSQALVLAGTAAFAFGAPAWGGFVVAGYLLLGGFDAARQQALARMPRYVQQEHRGLAFGMASTVSEGAVAAASVIGGILFALNPALPLYAGLILIPAGMMLTLRLRGPQTAVAADSTAAHAGATVPLWSGVHSATADEPTSG